MAENLVINDTTYENVENIEMLNTDGDTVTYYNGDDIINQHNNDADAHADLFAGKANTENLSNYVPTSRTINGKALTNDITLTPEDIGAGQTNAIAATVTLLASGWTDSGDGRYMQTVNVANVTATTAIILVDIHLYSNNSDQNEEIYNAWFEADGGPAQNAVVQGDGTLTFYADNSPTVDIPLNVGVL